MNNISINFSETNGPIKPVNAVNNGPTLPSVRQGSRSNFEYYKEAKFPYARNHDASFYGPYGGEHIVDVHRIFKYFGADENDPESYFFEPTDNYVKNTIASGTKVFYRLGAAIEHYHKYGTRVPKDFAKWARICEHIIAHYTEGWANGFHYDIEYWEIWNEPDCINPDGTNPCWQGTTEQFIDLFEVTAKHLKARFPHLKIGGPAFSYPCPKDFKNKFLNAVRDRNIPLDFYSYHWYGDDIGVLKETILNAQRELAGVGLMGTQTVLNEWNYVKGWLEDDWRYSKKVEKNLKGSSFVAGCLCVAQENPLDMFMYYDARPCGMNGLFDTGNFARLKPYYPFLLFSKLSDMGRYVKADNKEEDIYICAAKTEGKAGFMLTYYNDNDGQYRSSAKPAEKIRKVGLDILMPDADASYSLKYYLTDETRDNELIKEEIQKDGSFKLCIDIDLYSTYYIELEKQG